MQIGITVLPGFMAAAFGSVIDVFATANHLRPDIAPGLGPFDVVMIGAAKTVRSSDQRVAISTDEPVSAVGSHDLALVVGSAARSMNELSTAIEEPAARRLIRALSSNCQTSCVAAACTSTFFVAEAGLLDGYRAATSWWLAPDFTRRYPAIELDSAAMVVNDGLRITAGAALAHLDLALAIVGSCSPELAAVTAKFLLIDERPSQSVYAAVGHLTITDELAREFERHVRAKLNEPLDIAEIARSFGVNRRTLERRVRDAFGMSPLSVVQQLRIEHARHLRLTTNYNLDQIAASVGYQNTATLRRILKRPSGR